MMLDQSSPLAKETEARNGIVPVVKTDCSGIWDTTTNEKTREEKKKYSFMSSWETISR